MPNQRKRSRQNTGRRSAAVQSHGGVVGKLIVMLAVVAAVVLGVAIFFRVNQIQVQGNRIYSQEQVIDVSGVETGDNLLTVNKAAIVGNVYANLPYIRKVSVGRVLPDAIVIKVEESEIAGLVKSDTGASWYINAQGRVLGSSVDGFNGQIVELTGFTLVAPAAGKDAVASEGMQTNMEAALNVLSCLEGTGLIELTTAIDAEKGFDLVIKCSDRYEIRLGSDEQLDYKIWCLQEVLERLSDHQTGVIDLSMASEQSVRFIPWE
ncbi:MAG: FtsQ-type POTRA domain-containing protein [Oscillospiraceae bacterium]|nr:FtsQ-type POTRA domain-containing protein [Oscillospiraceae bacterium]